MVAARSLGAWLAQNKRRPGRQTSAAEVLPPTLAELGISPQLAARLDALANIPADLFDQYIELADEPGFEAGFNDCLAFAEVAAAATPAASFRSAHPVTPMMMQAHRTDAAKLKLTLYKTLPTTGTTEWCTPAELFQAMGNPLFDMDVCSPGRDKVPWIPAKRHITKREDGLLVTWHGFVWCNAPFGVRNGVEHWIDKFIEHGNGIFLATDFTSTNWWQDLIANSDYVLFCCPKVQYLPRRSKQGNALGTTLAAIGEKGVAALVTAEQNGRGIALDRRTARREATPRLRLATSSD